jgi:hypothetical protein
VRLSVSSLSLQGETRGIAERAELLLRPRLRPPLTTFPFLASRSYTANVASIGQLYEAAKEKHAKGIDLLVEKFDYHPGFSKGRPGEFRGQPFRPK